MLSLALALWALSKGRGQQVRRTELGRGLGVAESIRSQMDAESMSPPSSLRTLLLRER